ncbi:MAG TPA: M15 family metallopeptidase [Spirochaetales bacterium]|nr:M15 family metallopeptidase [Spirochaetales bacterium]HOV37163.1 M15 family metallopeptidase [Spirochaetales bacterium]
MIPTGNNFCLLLALLLLGGCTPQSSPVPIHPRFQFTQDQLLSLLSDTGKETLEAVKQNPYRFLELLDSILATEKDFLSLVDKNHSLPENWEPGDLVPLEKFGIRTSRAGLLLRKPAALALAEMAQAARDDGIELLVSSTYRSYQYQKEVYQRVVNELGKEAADRESAQPGFSQHQLGTVVDFGSISDSFTGTPMEQWLSRRAREFGFSLSYPEGKETETGYRHESWHYRFIGKKAAEMERDFFQGNQQRFLEFLHLKGETIEKAWKPVLP